MYIFTEREAIFFSGHGEESYFILQSRELYYSPLNERGAMYILPRSELCYSSTVTERGAIFFSDHGEGSYIIFLSLRGELCIFFFGQSYILLRSRRGELYYSSLTERGAILFSAQ